MANDKSGQEIVTEFKNLMGNLTIFEKERDSGMKKIRDDFEIRTDEIREEIYQLEYKIDEIKNECEDECEEIFSIINVGKIQPTIKRLYEMNNIVHILTGKHVNEVCVLAEDDVKIGKNYYDKKIYYYDEFYDDAAMSLRAVIVGDAPVIGTDGKVYETIKSFELFIVGLTENKKRSFGLANNPLVCTKGDLQDGFLASLCVGDDLQEMMDFYEGYVKNDCGNSVLNDENITCEGMIPELLIEFKEFLSDVKKDEMKLHDYNEFVKSNYKIEDFKDIIAYTCPKCDGVYYTVFDVKNNPFYANYLCYKCDGKLVEFTDFVN